MKKLSKFLENMKRELGSNCTFLSFSNEKIKNKQGIIENKDCLLVYFKNDSGGKDKVRIPLVKEIKNMTIDDYNYIYNELKNGNRGETAI